MNARELAAAIRKGHTMIGESNAWPVSTINGKQCATCALGAALYGLGMNADDFDRVWEKSMDGEEASSVIFGISLELASEISTKHINGMPRLEIADWLDTLEPAQRQTFENFMQATLKSVDTEATNETDKINT